MADFNKMWAMSTEQEAALSCIGKLANSEFIWICPEAEYCELTGYIQAMFEKTVASGQVYTFGGLPFALAQHGKLECRSFNWLGKTVHLVNRLTGPTVASVQVRYADS